MLFPYASSFLVLATLIVAVLSGEEEHCHTNSNSNNCNMDLAQKVQELEEQLQQLKSQVIMHKIGQNKINKY